MDSIIISYDMSSVTSQKKTYSMNSYIEIPQYFKNRHAFNKGSELKINGRLIIIIYKFETKMIK